MTKTNLKKIEKIIKNQPDFNENFKFGKEEIQNNNCNSLNYWSEKSQVYNQKNKFMKRNRMFDKDGSKDYCFGVGMNPESLIKKRQKQSKQLHASYTQEKSSSDQSDDLIHDQYLDFQNEKQIEDYQRETLLENNSIMQEFNQGSRRSIKVTQPNEGRLLQLKENVFFPVKNSFNQSQNTNTNSNINSYANMNFVDNTSQNKFNPLYNQFQSSTNYMHDQSIRQPVKSDLEHRLNQTIASQNHINPLRTNTVVHRIQVRSINPNSNN